MNGQMYDPLVGRFLNADNFIQDPTSTQNYNRYSYCLNNPLKYTDVSGMQMMAIDQGWALGHSPTDLVDFMGNSSGSRGGGGGWGGNGGALPGWANGNVHYDSNNGAYTNDAGDIVPFSEVNNKYIGSNVAKTVDEIIFNGTPKNPYQNIVGFQFTDGSEFYYMDGGSLGGNINGLENRGAWSYNLYSQSETDAFCNFMLGIAGGEIFEGLEIGNLVKGLFAKEGTAAVQYTKSSLQLGQQMHKAYKAADVIEGVAMKEFRGIPGIRPDFVDFSTKTIFELKPFNPRAMQQGVLQLNKYQSLFEQNYGGVWKTVLDKY